jgi:hypothetical protein
MKIFQKAISTVSMCVGVWLQLEMKFNDPVFLLVHRLKVRLSQDTMFISFVFLFYLLHVLSVHVVNGCLSSFAPWVLAIFRKRVSTPAL